MIKSFLKSHAIHKKIVPSLDLLMLFRPTLFFGVWVMACIGMYIGLLINDATEMNITLYNIQTVILFFGITLICGSTFILNQIADVETDKINDKIYLLNQIIPAAKAMIISRGSCIIGFILTAIIDWIILFPLLLIFIVT